MIMNRPLLKALLLLFPAFAFAQNYVPVNQDPAMAVKPLTTPGATAFGLGEVKLLDGPFRQAMERDAAYLLEIEPDRLLHRFRLHAGLKPKGELYGGWEKESLSGHSLGHYLSACAIQYASTGDKRFLERVNHIVDELAECQAARGTGYVGAIPKEDSVWNLVSQGKMRVLDFSLNGAWSPWYTEHKVLAGLLDAWLHAGSRKALDISICFGDWTLRLLKDLNAEQIQRMLDCEFGGMNEIMVNLYAITGEKRFLDGSFLFEHHRITDPLASRVDDLNDRHSNTQIPKIIGSVRRHELTGDQRDRTVAEFFFETVSTNHTYAIGGNSDSEHLGKAGQLNERLSDNTAETCNTYNMLKLSRHLFTLQPRAGLADFYERALYNHILSSQRPTDGMMCYFTPLRRGGRKDYSDKFDSFWCCVGSGMENHVKYHEAIYYRGADGSLLVNLFIASELDWKEKGIRLKQETSFPEEPLTVFTISGKPKGPVQLRIRKPWWAEKELTFTRNGKQIRAALNKQGYYVINGTFREGDRIAATLPLSLRTEALPDNADRFAFLYGPVVLAAKMGSEEPDPLTGTPVMITADPNFRNWTTRDGNELKFRTAGVGSPKDVELIPFSSIHDERYNVYWDRFTATGWEQAKKHYAGEQDRSKAIERNTVDYLQTGDPASEEAHGLQHKNSFSGESNTRKWRDAREDGFIRFNLKADAARSNELRLSFWGSDGGGRLMFDIRCNGVTIATQEIRQNFPNRFFDLTYPLSGELTIGGKPLDIELIPHTDKRVARIFGARITAKQD